MIFELVGHQDVHPGLLVELHARLSGLLACGGRAEYRERVTYVSAGSAWSDSGVVGVSVWYSGDS